jgi:hypothetical protein
MTAPEWIVDSFAANLSAANEARTRMEPRTRDKRLLARIEAMISLAALAGGIAAAIYFRDVVAIGLIGCGIFVGLAFAYTMLALLLAWPRLRWREFLGEIVDFLAI